MVSCEDGDYEQLYLLIMLRSPKLKPLTLSTIDLQFFFFEFQLQLFKSSLSKTFSIFQAGFDIIDHIIVPFILAIPLAVANFVIVGATEDISFAITS